MDKSEQIKKYSKEITIIINNVIKEELAKGNALFVESGIDNDFIKYQQFFEVAVDKSLGINISHDSKSLFKQELIEEACIQIMKRINSDSIRAEIKKPIIANGVAMLCKKIMDITTKDLINTKKLVD
jgi:hypothetical protein